MKVSTVVLCLGAAFASGTQAQVVSTSTATPLAATAATLVPALIPFAGTAVSPDGKPLASEAQITFLLFKGEKGGDPVWIEAQTVALDPGGHYQVKLGASSSNGLPLDTFASGEVRWLEVQIAGQATGPRTLLTSVPYALKAADAATLGGLPASAFVLASSVAAVSGSPSFTANTITPAAVSNVTTTGGTNLYLPRFNAATTIINSQIYDNGKSVGIGGVPNPSVKLDVNGAMIMRGNMQVTRTGNATSSTGYPSYGFQFYSNAYNSSSKAGDNPYFQLQSEPYGNNTSAPSATFNLLFSNNGSAAAETGLSINSNGTINFASTQTFSGYSTTGGPGLYGTSSYGTGVSGTSQSGDGIYGATSGNTNGTAGVYGKSGPGSQQSGIAGVWGDSYYGIGVLGTSYSSVGIRGLSTSGVGAAGSSDSSDGVLGYTSGNTVNTAGVLGQVSGTSGFVGIAGVWGDTNVHVGVYGTSTSYAGVDGASTNGPGVQGASTTNVGGEFYGGQNTNGGYGIVATGGTGSTTNSGAVGGAGVVGYGAAGYTGGAGGIFQGSTGQSNQSTGTPKSGDGIDAYGAAYSNGGTFYGGISGAGISAVAASGGYNSIEAQGSAYIEGDLTVTGQVVALGDTDVRIDHPDDAANKYLVHSSVESSERMNMYTGNVVTDAQGLATVDLPAWFEGLNTDFRYQLTVMGQFAQAIVKDKVADRKFTIMTNLPAVEVSWQITAVRRDAYARAHPLVVEQDKPARERGLYAHPELFGEPQEKSVNWTKHVANLRRKDAQQAAAAANAAMPRPLPAHAETTQTRLPAQ